MQSVTLVFNKPVYIGGQDNVKVSTIKDIKDIGIRDGFIVIDIDNREIVVNSNIVDSIELTKEG